MSFFDLSFKRFVSVTLVKVAFVGGCGVVFAGLLGCITALVHLVDLGHIDNETLWATSLGAIVLSVALMLVWRLVCEVVAVLFHLAEEATRIRRAIESSHGTFPVPVENSAVSLLQGVPVRSRRGSE